MSPRRPLLAALLIAALVAAASPAMAMTPESVTPETVTPESVTPESVTPESVTPKTVTPKTVIPGWSPSAPPADRAAFDAQLADVTYAVSCRGVAATGWASSMRDDTSYDWRSMLVTTSAGSSACSDTPRDVVVRQGTETFPASPWITGSSSGLGSVAVIPYVTGAYWDLTPTPSIGQWVAIGGRAPDGALLPILERRIVAVDSTSFTMNQAVGADYLGAPVADNLMRMLGTLTRAGAEITGSPAYCDVIFVCEEPNRAWWDITAPSVPRTVKASAGKGRVTVTWRPALSDGGAEVDYRYSVNAGPWIDTSRFSLTVKARKGVSVMVSVQAFNAAGWGPTKIVSARAR